MVFNSPAHRTQLQALRSYVPTALFLSAIGWKQNGSGHILVDKTSREEMTCVVVGKVNDYRLNCSPIGNYRKEYPPLGKAKLQHTLGRPDEPAFVRDFEDAVKSLSKAQGTVASTSNRLNMLTMEGQDQSIRFTAPIFEKRVSGGFFFGGGRVQQPLNTVKS
jgi:hypothetical protein